MNLFKRLGIVLISIYLSACTILPPVAPPDADRQALWQINQDKLHTIDHWKLKGRIAFFTATERNSASLYWKQSPEAFNINLTGPFGGSLFTLSQQQGLATLMIDDNQYQDSSPQRLINQLTPWPIPVDELRHWILGEPLSTDIQLDNYGRVISARHDQGWQINYQKYTRMGEYWLPTQMTISNDDIRIKITTRDWELDE